MRKFWIENEVGTRYALNGEQNIWFTNPQGLGVTFNGNMAELGEGFFKSVESSVRQNSITGNITFLKNVYPAYRDFASFLMSAKSLFFLYAPTDVQFKVQVSVNFLTKSEINRGRWLQVPVSFSMLTPWYYPSAVEFSASDTPGNVMTYPWRYGDVVYGSTGAAMTVIVPPAGHIPASWELTYDGQLVNPVILITGQSTGAVIGRVVVGTTATGLKVSTRYLDSYVEDGSGSDLLPYVDLENDPYPRLPLSEPAAILLTATNEMSGTLKMTVNQYFRTV